MTDTERIALLTQRLERLENIEALRALRCRYHDLVNLDQGTRLYELFAPDATIAYSGRPEVSGRDNIREFFKNFPVQVARQFMHHHVVEVDGDRAAVEVAVPARPVRNGESLFVVGRFDDEYRRIDGRWYFQSVRLTVHYMVPPGAGWAEHLPFKGHAA
jgi:ketosteroid isomerase-like protein